MVVWRVSGQQRVPVVSVQYMPLLVCSTCSIDMRLDDDLSLIVLWLKHAPLAACHCSGIAGRQHDGQPW